MTSHIQKRKIHRHGYQREPIFLDEFVTARRLKNLEQKAAEAQIHG